MNDLGAEIWGHGNQQNIDVLRHTLGAEVCMALHKVCTGERVRRPFVK